MADARSTEEIEAEIAEGRERLAATVDQIAARVDVKSRASRKVASVKDSATTGSGSPRPEVLAAAGSIIAMAVVLLVWRRRRNH